MEKTSSKGLLNKYAFFRWMVLLLLVLRTVNGWSQISINSLIGNNIVFRNDDVWNFIILNTGNEANCSIRISLVDKSGQDILTVQTPEFLLKKGTNSNLRELKSKSETFYGANEAASILEHNGSLMAGDYQLCLKIKSNDNSLQYAEKCIHFHAKEFFVLRLVYPPDNGEIYSTQPLLRWMSTYASASTTYALKVTEMKNGQSESEALETNPLYVQEISISGTSFLYPTSAPALEAKKNYVWQVAALRNLEIVAVTEPWIFHLVNLDTVVLVTSDCYRLIHKISNNEFYINDGILRFGYQNLSNEKYLNYTITNLENKRVYKGKSKIKLSYGLNKIDIPLKHELKVKKNTRHLLRILDSNNNTYQLTFNAIDSQW